jgi:hypothetical protein
MKDYTSWEFCYVVPLRVSVVINRKYFERELEKFDIQLFGRRDINDLYPAFIMENQDYNNWYEHNNYLADYIATKRFLPLSIGDL